MQPIRIQRSRQQKQISPNGLEIVYVGRPSKFGNPFFIENLPNKLWTVKTYDFFCNKILTDNCSLIYSTKEAALIDCLKCFGISIMCNNLSELKGKNLSCWCKIGEPCHADILLELANKN